MTGRDVCKEVYSEVRVKSTGRMERDQATRMSRLAGLLGMAVGWGQQEDLEFRPEETLRVGNTPTTSPVAQSHQVRSKW